MTPITFLWHDYETFGTDARKDRPAQFAAIRTDADLNPIGEPINILCQPAPDYLPDPASCLITGITPQMAWQRGVTEREFAQRIEQEMALPDTISVGYNSIRFDDEVTRFMFWRNLMDPYAREWQNQCGRWDLLDVVRMTYALRPDGITWRQRDDGKGTSFKLEHLAEDNGLREGMAHEALSDVRALIGLARKLKTAQPKLWEYALDLRDKKRALRMLEERSQLQQLLSRTMSGGGVGGVQVLIGGEGAMSELSQFSMVLARYGMPGVVTGMLGVLGPMRMPYGRTISTVRYIAGILSGLVTVAVGEEKYG